MHGPQFVPKELCARADIRRETITLERVNGDDLSNGIDKSNLIGKLDDSGRIKNGNRHDRHRPRVHNQANLIHRLRHCSPPMNRNLLPIVVAILSLALVLAMGLFLPALGRSSHLPSLASLPRTLSVAGQGFVDIPNLKP